MNTRTILLAVMCMVSMSRAWATEPAVLEDKDSVAYQIGQQLRCPVCQGMPISESPSTMARDMMKQVRTMVQNGESREQIISHFTDRYGEWVLLAPKPSGFMSLVWILPPLVLLCGLGFVFSKSARRKSCPTSTHAFDTNDGDDVYRKAIRADVEDGL